MLCDLQFLDLDRRRREGEIDLVKVHKNTEEAIICCKTLGYAIRRMALLQDNDWKGQVRTSKTPGDLRRALKRKAFRVKSWRVDVSRSQLIWVVSLCWHQQKSKSWRLFITELCSIIAKVDLRWLELKSRWEEVAILKEVTQHDGLLLVLALWQTGWMVSAIRHYLTLLQAEKGCWQFASRVLRRKCGTKLGKNCDVLLRKWDSSTVASFITKMFRIERCGGKKLPTGSHDAVVWYTCFECGEAINGILMHTIICCWIKRATSACYTADKRRSCKTVK